MFVMTMTKRKLLRAVMFILVLLTGIAIGIFAILSSVNTKADTAKLPIYCVDRADNKISLTFDVAWANSNTDELLAILEQENVKATFFVTGEWCDKYPEDVLKFFKAGHEIQNHSDAHPHVKGMNINALIEDTKECSRKIEMITGTAPTLYRSPYGEYDDTCMCTIEGMGMKVIQWSNDSIDWDNPTPETIIQRTTQNINSGAILLFHNDLANTTKALPTVIKSLKEQGFEFVKVNDLVYSENYKIDSAGKQILNVDTQSAAVIFSENTLVNEAMQILAQRLTIADVDSLSDGMSTEIYDKIKPLLNEEQIAAIQTLSFDELKETFKVLATAVHNRVEGEGEATTPPTTTADVKGEQPAITTTAETTMEMTTTTETMMPETSMSETTMPETTITVATTTEIIK